MNGAGSRRTSTTGRIPYENKQNGVRACTDTSTSTRRASLLTTSRVVADARGARRHMHHALAVEEYTRHTRPDTYLYQYTYLPVCTCTANKSYSSLYQYTRLRVATTTEVYCSTMYDVPPLHGCTYIQGTSIHT